MKNFEDLKDIVLKKSAKLFVEWLYLLEKASPELKKNIYNTDYVRKSLHNFYMNSWGEIEKGLKRKHRHSDYYSPSALKQIKNGDYSNLIYEHIVPKKIITNISIDLIEKNHELTENFVYDWMKENWFVASITKSEDDKLLTRSKHNGINIFERYQTECNFDKTLIHISECEL